MKKFLQYLRVIEDMEIDEEIICQEKFYDDPFHVGLCETIEKLTHEEKNAFIYKLLEIISDHPAKNGILPFVVECLEDDEITERSNDNADYIFNLEKLGLPLFIEIDAQEWEAIEGHDYNKTDYVEYEINSDLNFNEYILITKIF